MNHVGSCAAKCLPWDGCTSVEERGLALISLRGMLYGRCPPPPHPLLRRDLGCTGSVGSCDILCLPCQLHIGTGWQWGGVGGVSVGRLSLMNFTFVRRSVLLLDTAIAFDPPPPPLSHPHLTHIGHACSHDARYLLWDSCALVERERQVEGPLASTSRSQ